jgi:hypothetical protein
MFTAERAEYAEFFFSLISVAVFDSCLARTFGDPETGSLSIRLSTD